MLDVSHTGLRTAGGLLAVCGLFLNSSPTAAQFKIVAITGQQVPGAPAGNTFASLSLAGINDLGQTAIIGESAEGQRVLVEDQGAFRTVAREGDAAPGAAAGFAFDGFPFAVLNDAGRVALVANYSPDGSGNIQIPGCDCPAHALWSEAGGSLQPIALFGDMMLGAMDPFASSKRYLDFSIPAFNVVGESAFAAHSQLRVVRDCSVLPCTTGVWMERNEIVGKVAIEGDPAPTLGTEFEGFDFYSDFQFPIADVAIALNDRGEAAFRASTSTPTLEGRDGLWSTEAGSLMPVILEGLQAPGLPVGTMFKRASGFFAPAINNAAQIASQWDLAVGGGVTELNNSAIWTGRPGNVRLVAREGDPAPGTAEMFSQFDNPIINRSGDTAFGGGAGPIPAGEFAPELSGIWVERSGQLSAVAVTDQPAPGLPFDGLFDAIGSPWMNASGQVAFVATLKVGQGGVTDETNQGIWAHSPNGELVMIARKGDTIDVDNGLGVDLRIISSLSLFNNVIFAGSGSGNEDGRPSLFNDAGQIAIYAEFTDGTNGVLVSNKVAVPEPSTLVLLVHGMAVLAICRCARQKVTHRQLDKSI